MTGGQIEITKSTKCFADVVMEIGNLVVERDRLADQLDGKLAAAGLDRNHSKQVKAVKMLRDPGQDLPVEILGLRKLALLVKRDGFAKSLLDVVRRSQYKRSCSLRAPYT